MSNSFLLKWEWIPLKLNWILNSLIKFYLSKHDVYLSKNYFLLCPIHLIFTWEKMNKT